MDAKNRDLYTEQTTLGRYRSEISKIIFVPVYQRNYGWLIPHCRTLFEDIVRSAKTGVKHMLGEMTCSAQDDYRIQLNDGQQRFISVLLLALAIRDVAEEMEAKEKNKERKEGYKNIARYAEGYIYATPLEMNGEKIIKVTVNYDDRMVMKQIVNHKDGTDWLAEIPEELRSECRIEPNYKFFLTEVRKYINNGGNAIDLLKAIDRMTITMTYCTVEQAQEIYANKNTKGLTLTSSENIKNILLSHFDYDEQNKIYSKYWLQMERKVHRKNLENFMTDVMIIINEMSGTKIAKWTTKNLYAQTVRYINLMMKNNKDKQSVAENILKQYLYFAELYNKHILAPAVPLSKMSELQLRMYEFEHIFKGGMGNCLVLYLLSLFNEGKINENVMANCMRALSTAQFRGKFVGQFKGQQRDNASKLLKEIYSVAKMPKDRRTIDTYLWKLMVNTPGTQGIPSDRTAIAYFTENQLGWGFGKLLTRHKLATRYLFYRMNEVYDPSVTLPEFTNNSCCVEHIIPPNNPKLWKKEVGTDNRNTLELYVERMGNMALVNRNSDNDSFAVKSADYAKSEYPLTRLVGERSQWTLKDVKGHTALLAKLFVKAFPIPNKYKNK